MDKLRSENKFAIMPEWVIELDISHTAFRLYAVLARYADNVTHQAFPSLETLAGRLGCGEKTVRRAIDDLVAHGAIQKHSRGRYQSSLYTVMTTAPFGSKVTGEGSEVSGEGSKVSTRLDINDQVTITTELEPTELEPLNKKANDFEQLFAEWWESYPNKKGKGAAKVAYRKALKKVSHDLLMERVERYRDDPNRVDLYTPYPQKWLNEERWDDEPETPRIEHKPRKLTNAEEGMLLTQKLRERDRLNAQQPKELDYDMGLRLKGVDDVD